MTAALCSHDSRTVPAGLRTNSVRRHFLAQQNGASAAAARLARSIMAALGTSTVVLVPNAAIWAPGLSQ